MVTIHEALDMLDDDKSFKDWQKSNPESYLCHCLKMLDDEDAWHIGFANQNQTITTFVVTNIEIEKKEDEEAFKHPDSKILPLSKEDIAITATQALSLAKEFIKSNYPKDLPSKSIIILQALDIGQVYNITFITLAMSTINIKISSKTGEVLDDKKTNLMDFKVDDV